MTDKPFWTSADLKNKIDEKLKELLYGKSDEANLFGIITDNLAPHIHNWLADLVRSKDNLESLGEDFGETANMVYGIICYWELRDELKENDKYFYEAFYSSGGEDDNDVINEPTKWEPTGGALQSLMDEADKD